MGTNDGDLIHKAVLDISDYLKKLNTIDANIDKMARAADKSFSGVSKSSQLSGVQIGAISGIVSSVTTAFIQLGQQAVGALVEIGQQSVQTAIEMDTLKARLGGIFDGSEEAADQAFTFIQKKSRELGIDLSELAGAFIPKTESLEQFERVAKIATALARSDESQGAAGARIAIIEALSGTFSSLNKRFEISKEDTKRVQDAFNKEGIEGFITTLETVLKESGKSFEDFAGTAQTAFAKVGIAGEQIGGKVGVPIVASLEEAANKLLEFIDANEDDLIVFADTVGRAIADVIDFIAGIDFSEFDTQTLIEIADYIFRIVNAAEIAGTQIATFAQQFSQLPGVSLVIQGLTYELTHLDDALLILSQILAIANASIAAFEASGVKAQVAMLLLSSTIKASHNDLVGAYEDFQKAEQVMASSTSAQDAFKESILASNQQFEDYRASLEGNTTAQDNLRDSLNEAANAGTDTADAMQAAAVAERALAEAGEEAAAAQKKIDDAKAKALADYQKDLLEADIKFERARTDTLLDFQRKREDAAKQNLQRISDIEKKNKQARDDSALELERDFDDISLKHSRERIEQRKDEAQKLVDLQVDTGRKIADILKESQVDLDEAERTRDAVGFLRIIRKRNQDIASAQQEAARKTQDTQLEGQRRREQLKIQQEQERVDARVAANRRLEDLATDLDRELEAQATSFERERAQIALNEERKLTDLATARDRDREDAARRRDEKLADLQQSLAAELEAVKKYNALLEAEAQRHAQAMAAAEAQANRQAIEDRIQSQANADDDRPGSRPGMQNRQRQRAGQPQSRPGLYNRLGRRQHGGPVNAGQPVLVGEAGPELFQPNQAGRIIPNSPLIMSNPTSTSVVSNISNVREGHQITIPDAAGLLSNPIAVRQIENIVLRMLDKTL